MNARILAVDDDTDLLDSVVAVLCDEGYAVTSAHDGAEAIARLPEGDFDVVVSDIAMPGASGIEVLRAVKETSPETEVVLVTAHATLSTATECLRAGAFDFVTKPLRLESLLAVIDRAVERRRLYQASQAILSNPEPDRLPRVIVEAAARVMGADDASVMMPGADGRLYVAYSHGLPPEVQASVRVAVGERVAGRVAQDRRPALLDARPGDDPRFAGVQGMRRVRSSIVYPLCSGDRLLGVLNLNRIESERPYNRWDLARAAILASQCVLALQNAELLRQAMVMERLASMGQVAAGIAHEINNPITYVLAGLSLMAEQVARHRDAAGADGWARVPAAELAEIAQAADEAHEGAARIRDIVRDIGALARADASDASVFDVSDPVRSAVRMLGAEIRGRAELELRLEPGLRVAGSPGPLSQVFMNLLTNAAHAVAQGGARPATITVESAREGAFAVVRVRDTGTGIPPEVVPRLFEPFFTTKRKGGAGPGTGLGLAISRQIVTRYRGRIRVESQLGVGTTFSVELPLVGAEPGEGAGGDGDEGSAGGGGVGGVPGVRSEAVPAARPARGAEPGAQRAAGEAPSRPRVLLVDDEPVLLRMLRRTLERGHEVTTAEGGARALELLRGGAEFDVVVCDMLMPDVNGMELFRAVQSERPELCDAFVFVTGCATQPEVAAFLGSVPNAVLEKPEGLEEIPAVIARRMAARD